MQHYTVLGIDLRTSQDQAAEVLAAGNVLQCSLIDHNIAKITDLYQTIIIFDMVKQIWVYFSQIHFLRTSNFQYINAIYNMFLFDTGHFCHYKTCLHHLKIGCIKL